MPTSYSPQINEVIKSDYFVRALVVKSLLYLACLAVIYFFILLQGAGPASGSNLGGNNFKGKVLVLLEHSAPRTFGGMAPQFKGIFSAGGTRPATLKNLKNGILAFLDECCEADSSYQVATGFPLSKLYR